jgi:protein-S-isoprenylcysteine O-methyltransferase Ste14
VRNLLVLAMLYLAQAVRMRREEDMLRAGDQQAAYAAYCIAVRYRIVPFVF